MVEVPTYKNGDDWGMVYGNVLPTIIIITILNYRDDFSTPITHGILPVVIFPNKNARLVEKKSNAWNGYGGFRQLHIKPFSLTKMR